MATAAGTKPSDTGGSAHSARSDRISVSSKPGSSTSNNSSRNSKQDFIKKNKNLLKAVQSNNNNKPEPAVRQPVYKIQQQSVIKVNNLSPINTRGRRKPPHHSQSLSTSDSELFKVENSNRHVEQRASTGSKTISVIQNPRKERSTSISYQKNYQHRLSIVDDGQRRVSLATLVPFVPDSAILGNLTDPGRLPSLVQPPSMQQIPNPQPLLIGSAISPLPESYRGPVFDDSAKKAVVPVTAPVEKRRTSKTGSAKGKKNNKVRKGSAGSGKKNGKSKKESGEKLAELTLPCAKNIAA